MPQSYSSLWVHLIWSTKNREPILTRLLKQEVYKVVNEVASDHEIYLDCINGVENHVHLLIRLRTDQSIADIVKTIKENPGNILRIYRNNIYIGRMVMQPLPSVPTRLQRFGIIFITRKNIIVTGR
jgi:REP element-mobilizing transposase RayT